MARSQNSFIKNQKAQKKKKKRQEKLQKKIDKKDQDTSGSLDDMIAYVDHMGNIVDEKPLPPPPPRKPREEQSTEDKK
jgi:hypothetical protein